ncbi:MAG TPA: YaiO family outer membrane beta-barrel protein [Candidatus Lustribacter sp.]|jgi:YaiO family outer membrane protein|nr:YaiO family outer membrane beta-barrel protein [Candidatus Lustribacter sp.]
MIIQRCAILVAGVLLALITPPLGARAGELDLTGSLSNFTSPTPLGPWGNVTLTDREVLRYDTPGLALVDQIDGGGVGATHSLGFVLDDYHTFSPRFFVYAAFGLANGAALPTHNAYLEGDMKFGAALQTVIGLGAGTVLNPDGTVQNYLNVGPTWYHNNFNVTLRWLPSFTAGRSGASTGIVTLADGEAGKTVSTLTLLGGSSPPYGIVTLQAPSAIGQRVLFAGIDVKHWVNPKGGFHVGFEYQHLTDATTGNVLYVQRTVVLGVFRQIGPGPAP